MKHILFGLSAFLMTGLFVNCKQREFNTAAIQSNAEVQISMETKRRWNGYLDGINYNNLQEECLPRRYAAKGQLKGIVVFYHGYSACPQQFWDIGEMLSADGYEVFLPLSPGHGAKTSINKGKVQYNVTELPDMKDFSRYGQFTSQMSNMVKSSPGIPHIVAGLSLGGALSAHSLLSEWGKGTWDAGLMIAPMFAAMEGFNGQMLQAISGNPLTNFIKYTWPGSCDNDVQTPLRNDPNGYARGGFCAFQFENLGAIDRFGNMTFDILNNIDKNSVGSPKVRVGFLVTETDSKTRPKTTNDSFAMFKSIASKNSNVSVSGCTYDKQVPHSFLSRYDDQASAKFWLNSALGDIRAFVAGNSRIEARAPSTVFPSYGMCEINANSPQVPVHSPRRFANQLDYLKNTKYSY